MGNFNFSKLKCQGYAVFSLVCSLVIKYIGVELMTIEVRPELLGIVPIPVGRVRTFLPGERLSVVAEGSSMVRELEVSPDRDGLIVTEGQKLNHHLPGAGVLRRPILYKGRINRAHLRPVPENSGHGIRGIISFIAPETVHWRKTRKTA